MYKGAVELTRTPDVPVPPRRFVPDGFDPADLGALAERTDALLARPVGSPADLREWVVDWGELGGVVDGEHVRRLTAMNRDTRRAELAQRLVAYQTEVLPAWERHEDRLIRRYLESPHRAALGKEFEVFDRCRAKAAEIFREANTELQAKVEALGSRYQEIQGAVTVEFRGRTLTPEQSGAVLQETDRGKREEAWRALSARRRKDRERLDALFDEQLALRHRIARNAGFASFTDYTFARLNRFDYTPADCRRYQEAVAKVVVPVLAELRRERQRRLGVGALRPWDLDVSLFGAAPAELFRDQDGYVALVRRVFRAVDPAFAADFDVLVRNGLLDLMSRPGKAPGGYNAAIEDIRLPFIFYNAVGRRGDLGVMLHEGGHAFHTLAVRDLDLHAYRSLVPSEFCEVASMSMEFLGFERLDGILGADELRDFTWSHFEGILGTFAHVAMGDAFQAWVYGHPGHSPAERHARWIALADIYMPGIDWSGLSDERIGTWQRILHFFLLPFYFIEYGIAQIGALQLWQRELEDHEAAVRGYRRALSLGGSRPLPELFAAAGLRFAMDEAILREVVPPVTAKLRGLLAG